MGPLSYLKSLFGVSDTSETPQAEKLTPREATRLLTEEVTAGYRPTSPLANFYSGSAGTPSLARMLADVEAMLVHPRVSTTLDYYKGGIAGAKFVLQDASSPEVGKFALAELETFWRRGRQAVQRSYEYGRGGCEIVYSREDGAMRFASAHPVAPLDCRVLTRGSHYAGFRLRGSQPLGAIDLWGASGWMPCKGLWFAHNPRYSRWYGWPRLYAAWRPWKRLAGKDGAEETVDGGVYRFAFAPPIGRYPAQDERVKGPDGSTSQWSNRDKMREMLEHMKAGGVVAFSSRRDESGDYVWDVDWPQGSLDVDGLLVYTDNLEKAISLGVGVPPELIEASEVGSGYSGRAIPLEVFYAGQQHNADALVEVWYRQIGEPLLRFNFGSGSWARITVEDLLKSRMQNLQQSQSQNPPEQPTRPPGQPVQFSTFREEDHPRADDGRFGRKSGSHSSSDGSQGKAGAPSGETVDNDGNKSQAERSGSKGGKSFDHPEKSTTVQQFVAGKIPRDVVPHSDHLLAGVLSESGRDETPDVVDSHQIDQLHAKGWRMLFRGVSRPEQAEQFRTGEMFSGLGIYGNGTYVAYAKKGFFSNGIVKAKGIADKYAGRRQEPSGGAVLRMALPPDAKIVSHAQIKKEAEEYKDHLRQRLYDREITSEQHDALKHIANDEGRFAALRNYDAIEVKDEGYMVILNRSILAVDRHSY